MGRTDISRRIAGKARSFHRGNFRLASDLVNLERVHSARAVEATVFYCARMLEACTAAATDDLKLRRQGKVFHMLVRLGRLNMLASAARYWAHGLRRLGNQVRHVTSTVSSQDAQVAVLFLERILKWYFEDYPFGRRLDRVFLDGSALGLDIRQEYRSFLGNLEAARTDRDRALALLREDHLPILLECSVFPSFLTEVYLNLDELEAAREVLERSRKRFRGNVRLRQLEGVLYSREGRLKEAYRILTGIREHLGRSSETSGVLAGVLKRMWREDRANRKLLQQTQKAYQHGWRASQRTDAYTGVNLATMTLILGGWEEAGRTAREVLKELDDRKRAFNRKAQSGYVEGYWDSVARAEANLVLGEIERARTIYQDAFGRYPTEKGRHGSTRTQGDLILEAMGIGARCDEFWSDMILDESKRELRVGVVGHRALEGRRGIAARVRKGLDRILERVDRAATRLVVLSPLAEGADRLVTVTLMGAPHRAGLRAVLPSKPEDYAADFLGDGRRDFFRLLAAAEAIDVVAKPSPIDVVADRSSSRELAYLACGKAVVDGSEVLLAVWDGKPARGTGGTAEIVAYAKRRRRPIVVVPTDPEQPLEFHRLGSLAGDR